jgi:hypothetical protein
MRHIRVVTPDYFSVIDPFFFFPADPQELVATRPRELIRYRSRPGDVDALPKQAGAMVVDRCWRVGRYELHVILVHDKRNHADLTIIALRRRALCECDVGRCIRRPRSGHY